MSAKPPARGNIVATIFGGANLRDLLTQQGAHDILNWTNPVLSTFFFLFANLCIYIIFFGNYSLVSVACYLAMAHLIVTLLLCQVGHFMAKFQNVELPPARDKVIRKINEEAVTALAVSACGVINKAISWYQTASDGSSIVVSIIAPVLLYFTARVFAYLSLVRIAYIVFLCVTLRPLARKYFSPQMDQVYDVIFRFVNAIVSPAPVPAREASVAVDHAVAGGGVQAQASTSKKEM